MKCGSFTWRAVRVVFGEFHLGLEITAIVPGVWIDHDESDFPIEHVIFI